MFAVPFDQICQNIVLNVSLNVALNVALNVVIMGSKVLSKMPSNFRSIGPLGGTL